MKCVFCDYDKQLFLTHYFMLRENSKKHTKQSISGTFLIHLKGKKLYTYFLGISVFVFFFLLKNTQRNSLDKLARLWISSEFIFLNDGEVGN